MSGIPTRRLGTGGPEVTVLGYGAMELRGLPHRKPRPITDREAEAALSSVLDSGITFIDTAVDYGTSEELIGRYLAHRRDEYVLASKVGCPLEHQPEADPGRSLAHDYSPANLRAGLAQSLRRLRTDHLDLVQLHISPSLETIRQEDAIGTLLELRDRGDVRFIGISSSPPNLDDHLGVAEFQTIQLPYSAAERRLEARITRAAESGKGVIVRGGVAQGAPARRVEDWDDIRVEELRGDDTTAGFLLRFAITHPGVTTVIVGSADSSHIAANAHAAARGPLPADVYAETVRRLDEAGIRPLALAEV
ncbi:aldo/keto reductase [Protaetiibacter larvae]|uniref:Aldo/keto reductase n=1 Tax=Protaetiibacter larvae TaxID=2592654 RepID=A0A5C1Y7S6_9MICO|nr:aldo/keto reductase [Protaetiibacter larvae]QEO09458.1 aldo/keto reductase [Protaetiibacter larvae]